MGAAGRHGDGSASEAPAVSVVTATYDSSATLRLALQSLLLQSFGDFEAWVVGDACTDDSEGVVAAFGDPRLHWLNLSRNSGGQAAPNNAGLQHARGELVAYLGHDDLWFPWHLAGLVAFAREARADLVHPLSAVLEPQGLVQVVGPPGRGRTYEDHFVFPSSWLHRRQGCGVWGDADTLGTGVDMDFLRRLHRRGGRIAYLEQLSVLKFPSAAWRMYDRTGSPPQLPYLDALQRDPEELHRRLLLQVATYAARADGVRRSPGELLRELPRAALRALVDLYGRERWPLRSVWRWHFQGVRQRLRVKRGLASAVRQRGDDSPASPWP